jgi:hypothetical protein
VKPQPEQNGLTALLWLGWNLAVHTDVRNPVLIQIHIALIDHPFGFGNERMMDHGSLERVPRPQQDN